MNKKTRRKYHSTKPLEMPQMPFDDALRKILSAKQPQQRTAKKKGKKRG